MLSITSTILGIIPPAEVCDGIDLWRKRFNRLPTAIPPHITLTYPPFIAPERWPVFSLELAESLAEVKPFEVCLDGAGIFQGFPMTLWLYPRDDGTLMHLRKLLEHTFPGLIAPLPFDYTPHITVGLFDDYLDLQTARKQLEDGWKALSFTVDRIYFIVQQSAGLWRLSDFVRMSEKPRYQDHNGTA